MTQPAPEMTTDDITEAYTTAHTFDWSARVPDVLPEGETEQSVDEIGRRQVVQMAAAAGYQILPETFVVQDLGPATNVDTGPGRIRRWAATGVQVKPRQEVVVEAKPRYSGMRAEAWVADLPEPHNGGIYSVRHGFDMTFIVECFRADGSPIGHMDHIPIAEGDVEVIAMPETARIVISEAPEEPQDDEDDQAGA